MTIKTNILNIPEPSTKRIVIVGGGFGGLKLALRLIKLDFQIVLINIRLQDDIGLSREDANCDIACDVNFFI